MASFYVLGFYRYLLHAKANFDMGAIKLLLLATPSDYAVCPYYFQNNFQITSGIKRSFKSQRQYRTSLLDPGRHNPAQYI